MIKLILAFAVSSVIAHMCTSALPFQVGSLIDGYGFSATAAGLVSAADAAPVRSSSCASSRSPTNWAIGSPSASGRATAAIYATR